MTLMDQLNRLSEIAPEVCRIIPYSDGNDFAIGDYVVSRLGGNELRMTYKHIGVTGRPALAWLRDALEAAIEARGWEWEIGHRIHDGINHYAGNIWVRFPFNITQSNFYDSTVEALLAAFVAAVEGEKERER